MIRAVPISTRDDTRPTAIGPDEWRDVVSHWATGVAVLTSMGQRGPRGCTANALASLSLDPLLLLACFDLASNTLQAVRESGRFAVNVLAAGQEQVARHFATKDGVREKFDGIEYNAVKGVPVLSRALGWVVCDVERELPGGDHVIVLARPLCSQFDGAASPLVFFRRRYAELLP